MTKLKMLASLYGEDTLYRAGSKADVPDDLAKLWLAQGYAEPVVEAPKKASEKPTPASSGPSSEEEV